MSAVRLSGRQMRCPVDIISQPRPISALLSLRRPHPPATEVSRSLSLESLSWSPPWVCNRLEPVLQVNLLGGRPVLAGLLSSGTPGSTRPQLPDWLSSQTTPSPTATCPGCRHYTSAASESWPKPPSPPPWDPGRFSGLSVEPGLASPAQVLLPPPWLAAGLRGS